MNYYLILFSFIYDSLYRTVMLAAITYWKYVADLDRWWIRKCPTMCGVYNPF